MRISLINIRKILDFHDTFKKNVIDGRDLDTIYKIIFEEKASNYDPGYKIKAIESFVNNHYLELVHEAAVPEMPDHEITTEKTTEIKNGVHVEVYSIKNIKNKSYE